MDLTFIEFRWNVYHRKLLTWHFSRITYSQLYRNTGQINVPTYKICHNAPTKRKNSNSSIKTDEHTSGLAINGLTTREIYLKWHVKPFGIRLINPSSDLTLLSLRSSYQSDWFRKRKPRWAFFDAWFIPTSHQRRQKALFLIVSFNFRLNELVSQLQCKLLRILSHRR